MSVKWAQTRGHTNALPMVSALQEHHHVRPRDGTQGREQGGTPCLHPPTVIQAQPTLVGSQPVSPHTQFAAALPIACPPPPPSSTSGSVGWGSGLFSHVCLGKSQPVLGLVYNWFGDSSCPSPYSP